jgi:putative protease
MGLFFMELLAPAGSKESFKAAIAGGADAIYLGGKNFGARRLAENFTDSELKAAVKIAHEHGVKVYVTVNTLIKEGEIQPVFSYLDFLSSINADAVIIQDRGILRIICENFSIPVHASTQMGIHSPEGAIWAQKNGVARIILARELHLDELQKIRKAVNLELEVFIHGALCYSFSGQCLFSSTLGGRSGNRGLCVQPCRKQYTLVDERGYLLSTADIFGVEALPDLLKIGVDGLKIEGRMRSPLYVYLTSNIYSKAIKRAEEGKAPLMTERERELLQVVFNRGFCKGYLYEDNVMQRKYPGSRGLPLGKASSDGEKLLAKADNLRLNDGVTLYRGDEKVGGFVIRTVEKKDGFLVLSPPFRVPKGEYQLYKTKDREFSSIEKKVDALKFPSDSVKTKFRDFPIEPHKRARTNGELSFYLSSLKSLEKVMPYADRVYFEWNKFYDEAKTLCEKAQKECVLILPRLSFVLPKIDAESLMVSSVDQFEKYADRKLYGHYSMNFFNSFTVPDLFQHTLSVELSRNDIKEIAGHYSGRIEVMAFGRIELMVSRDPSLDEGTLIDEKKKRFPVYRDRFGYIHILNSSDLFLLDYLDDLESMGIDSFGIDLRRRDSELSEIVAKAFHKRDISKKPIIKKKCGSITARHYAEGVN